MIGRRPRPPLEVGPRERLLAWAETVDGDVVGGTRQALYLAPGGSGPTRVPWEGVEAAEWDRDGSVLRISEVGVWGEQRVVHRVALEDPGDLVMLVRERVTASIVWQRHVPVTGRRGLRVIGRRAPIGDAPVRWYFEYDAGVDPWDEEVRRVADAALAQARADTGL